MDVYSLPIVYKFQFPSPKAGKTVKPVQGTGEWWLNSSIPTLLPVHVRVFDQ